MRLCVCKAHIDHVCYCVCVCVCVYVCVCVCVCVCRFMATWPFWERVCVYSYLNTARLRDHSTRGVRRSSLGLSRMYSWTAKITAADMAQNTNQYLHVDHN